MPTVINPKPFSPVHCCAEVDGASLPGVPEMMGQGKHGVAQLTCPVWFFSRASWEQLRITKALWRSMRWGSLCEEEARTTRKDYVSWGKLVRTNHFLKFCSRILFLPAAFCWAFSRLNASLRQKLSLFLFPPRLTVLVCIHREDHWDPHPCFWHGDSHDGDCGHGARPSAYPQPTACCSPHCQLSPQRQRQPVGESLPHHERGTLVRSLLKAAWKKKKKSWPPLYLCKALRKLKWLCLCGLSGGALPMSTSLVQNIWSLKTNNVTLASTENLVI